MTAEQWQQVKSVLLRALQLRPEERSAFLDQACGSDQSIRHEVNTLLASSDDMRSSFLESVSGSPRIAPGTSLGDYQVEDLLGAGGMGEVYRARDTRLGRYVAIKVLPRIFANDSDRLRRFEQEARAAAALNHPNILAVFQMGTHEGAPYIVSELLEGRSLREELTRGPLPVRKATEYGIQIARGLKAAHEKGIIHRDLKPENLFLTQDGRIKIVDFGLAKLRATERYHQNLPTVTQQTAAGMIMGTTAYMSPEQARGQAVDLRSDIFSFGAVLYETLSGSRAFQGTTSADIISAVLSHDPTPITQLNPTVPPALDRIILRCLEKNPDERFHSAMDVAFALDAISHSTPPYETGPTAATRFSPRYWIGGLALALTLAAIVITGSKLRNSAMPARQHSLKQRKLTGNVSENAALSGAISPDGKYLAYSEVDGLRLRLIVTGETRAIPQPNDLKGSEAFWVVGPWFPDGTRFVANLALPGERWSVWVVSVLGETPKKLLENAYASSVDPLTSRIIYKTGGRTGQELYNEPRFSNEEIWTMDSEGGDPQKFLHTDDAKTWFSGTQYSPDGTHIAFVRVQARDEGVSKFEQSIQVLPRGERHRLQCYRTPLLQESHGWAQTAFFTLQPMRTA